jgi:hypothetical protein
MVEGEKSRSEQGCGRNGQQFLAEIADQDLPSSHSLNNGDRSTLTIVS